MWRAARRRVRAVWRLLQVLLHIVRGALTMLLYFPRRPVEWQQMMVQLWSRQLLQRLGIGLQLEGAVPLRGPVLLVANHISWLDITVLHAARHCRFVSKADVQRWPVLGFLAGNAGTLFIERRSRRDAHRMAQVMADYLQQGEVLAIFPEGTTGDGVDVLHFHGNLLESAIAADAPCVPVGLTFVDGASGALSFAPCYVGDDTLLQSLWRTLCADGVVARVRFGQPQYAQGRDRRQWAAAMRLQVVALRRG